MFLNFTNEWKPWRLYSLHLLISYLTFLIYYFPVTPSINKEKV